MTNKNLDANEILKATGIPQLTDQSSPNEIHAAILKLGVFLAGADPVLKELCAGVAIMTLRLTKVLTTDVATKLVRSTLKSDVPSAGEDQWKTYGVTPLGDHIIDIVRKDRELLWVIAHPPGTRTHPLNPAVEIVSELDERRMWPRPALPWQGIPEAVDVERAWAREESARDLFLDLTDVFRAVPPKRTLILPEPEGVWASLLALWVMGTYLLEKFTNYPVLLLVGPAIRGKTRLGSLAIYLAWRGEVTPSTTTAVIFRNAERHRYSLFIDVMDLPEMIYNNESIRDLLLSRYGRDQRVSRVVRVDAPSPPDEIKSFGVYGATILASNKPLKSDHPLASRCIPIPMPEKGRQKMAEKVGAEHPVILKLRARLIAWAANVEAEDVSLPDIPHRLHGRQYEISRSLFQVAGLAQLQGAEVDALVELLSKVGAEQRVDMAESWESRVVVALDALRLEGQWKGEVGVGTVTDRLNDHIGERDQLKTQSVTAVAKHLGLKRVQHGGRSYIIYPGAEMWKDLTERFSPPDATSPTPPEESD